MQNCDKAILVAYIDVSLTRGQESKKFEIINSFRNYLEKNFENNKEINDDSLVILVIPSDKTEIQLLNARYPDYKTIVDLTKHQLDEYIESENIHLTK